MRDVEFEKPPAKPTSKEIIKAYLTNEQVEAITELPE